MLFGNQAEEMTILGFTLSDCNLPCSKVTRSYITDFTLMNGILERTPQLVPRYGRST